MQFNSWELLALEKCLELGIKQGKIDEASGIKLLDRFINEKPKKEKRS